MGWDPFSDLSRGIADLSHDISGGLADVEHDISSGLADVEHDISSGLADLNHDINANLANFDSSLGLSTTITNLVKNPLPTLATYALVAVGVPQPIASAMVTMANGGSFEQGITSMATAYISQYVGEAAGESFKGSQFEQGLKNIDPALAKTITQAVTSASGSAAVAALTGKSSLSDILAAAANGAVTSYVTQTLTKQMGYTDPKQLSTKLVSSAVSSATNAILKGQDIAKAVTGSVVQTALTETIKTNVDSIVANNETLSTLQTGINNAVNSAKDYYNNTVVASYKDLKNTNMWTNIYADKYNDAVTTLSNKAVFEERYRSGYTYAMTYPPGRLRDLALEGAQRHLTYVEDAAKGLATYKAQYEAYSDIYQDKLASFDTILDNYDSRVQTVTNYNTQIDELNTTQTGLVKTVSEDVATFEGEAANNANLLATQIGAEAVAASKESVAEVFKPQIIDAYKTYTGRKPTQIELESYMELDSVNAGNIDAAVDAIATGQEAQNYAATKNGVDSTTLEADKPEANQAITDWFNRSAAVKESWANAPSLKPGEDMTTLMTSAPKAVTEAFNKDMIKGSADFSTAYAMARTAYGSNKTFEWTNPDTGKTGTFTTNTQEEVKLQPFNAKSMSRSGLGGAAQAALDAGKTSFTWADGKTYKVPDAYAFLKGGDQSPAENKRLLEAGVAEVKSNGQTALDNVLGKMGEGAGEMIQGFGKAMALATGDANYKNAVITAGNMLSQWGENKSSGTALATETANVLAGVAAAEKSDNPFTAAAIVGKAVLDNPIGLLGMVGSEGTQEGVQHLIGGAAGVLVGGLTSLVATPVAGTAAGLATYKGVMALTEGIMVFGEAGQEIETKLTKQGVSPEKARDAALMGASGAALVAIPAEYIADKAILGSYMDGIKGGIKEFAIKYGTSTATQVVSGMVEGASQSAITQYATTGKVNMTAAATSGYFEAIIGAATGAALVTPAGIKDLTVIGKDFAGSNVTFRDFLSGDKTVNPDTFNTSISLGKSASGSDLTLGSFTAMGINAGFDTEMLSNILPPALTSLNTVVGTDPQGNTITFGQLSALTQNGTDPDAENIVGNLFADTQYVTQAEAKAEFANAGAANPTPEQLAAYTGQKDQTATLPEIKAAVATNTAANETALTKAITDLRATGMPEAQIATTVADAVKGVTTNTSLDAAVAGLKTSGLSPEQVTASVTAVAKTLMPATAADVATAVANATAATQTQIAGVSADLAQTEKDILAQVALNEKAGMTRDAALQKALNTVAAAQKTDTKTLTSKIGTLGTTLGKEIAGVSADLAQTEKDILAQVALNEKAGMTRDAALQKALNTVAAAQKTDTKTLTSKIGTLGTTLGKEIAGVSADVQAKYDTLTAAQKATADALIQQGTDTATAIANAAAATETQIASVSADVQAKYDALTTAQKTAVDSQVQMGKDLSTAIANAAAATETQIAGVSADVQTKYDTLTTAQKAEVDARVQQGLDLNAAINAASTATAAGFTGVQKTLAEQQAEAEKQREIDRATAAANAEAVRQQGIKAAQVATRRAQIGRATTQTGNVLSDLKQQAAAMRAAPTVAPEVVQAGANFDLSQPLNTGFFSGYAQQQKTNQLQPGTAKIASGGYLDDLLNAIR